MSNQIQEIIEQIDKAEQSLLSSQKWLTLAKATRRKCDDYADPMEFAEHRTNVREQTVLIHSLNRKLKLIRPDKEQVLTLVKEVFPEEAYKELKKYVQL